MPVTDYGLEEASPVDYAIEYFSGKKEIRGHGPPAFTLLVADGATLDKVVTGDAYSVARAYVNGEFDVTGDLVAALRWKQTLPTNFVSRLFSRLLSARFALSRIETWFQTRRQSVRNVRFHYDVSNDFYRAFLDSRLIYSAGYYGKHISSLERAQEAKLQAICRDLDLHRGDRLLDVGCGWGALLIYAAEKFGARASGCTLSHSQYQFADSAITERGLDGFASVKEADYRDITGRFDKIASVGMYEHVGRHRLASYFSKISGLLESGGLFVNSGITRPQAVCDDAETWFLLKRVFPGGELPHLAEVIRAAEGAGFTLLKMQSLREDYARTCRAWVERLREQKETCESLVGAQIYRTWLLYLSASALSFEQGQTDVFSTLMAKR